MYRVITKRKLSGGVYLIRVAAPMVARSAQPGQFVIVTPEEDGERIPLTITDSNEVNGSIDMIYQVVGYSTARLAEIDEGSCIPVLLGPLGLPAHYNTGTLINKVLGIGGGIGTAPLYPQIRSLNKKGVHTEAILGGRSIDLVILRDEFAAVTDRLYFVTDDGTLGMKGLVTNQLQKLLQEGESYDLIIAIGPPIMMKAVVSITKPLNIPTWVSLNPLMLDGTGMCGSCRVTIAGKVKFACVDGPDFNGFDVDFDEVMTRQRFYRDEEHECANRVRKTDGSL